jgi:integrase
METWSPAFNHRRIIFLIIVAVRAVMCCTGEDRERPFIGPQPKFWSTTAANATLQDLTSRHVGLDINPHLIRAAVGLVLAKEHPGAIGLARDILGHKSMATTEIYYSRYDAQRARQLYQGELKVMRERGR